MTNGSYEDSDQILLECIATAENFTNISVNPWQYIRCYQGPQTQDIGIAVSVTAINFVIFVTGLLGNLAVCIVIIRHQTLNSPTDYYLLNLALADVTLLIFGLPYDVTLYWHQYPWDFGETACKIRALISEMASYASVLTVVAFSTERYLAICHPLYKLVITSMQRALRIIICLWIISFLCALPFAVHSAVHYVEYPRKSKKFLPESALCAMTSQPENFPLTEISSIVFFIIPMIAIIFQYVKMGIVIRQTTNTNGKFGTGGSVHGRNRRQLGTRNIVKMLSCVVLGFFGCWFPFHAQRLTSIYLREYAYFDDLNYWMYIITGIFYYFSSTLNPILYNVMSDRMRNAFKEVICCVKHVDARSHAMTRETSHILISRQPSSAEERETGPLTKNEQLVVFTYKITGCVIQKMPEVERDLLSARDTII